MFYRKTTTAVRTTQDWYTYSASKMGISFNVKAGGTNGNQNGLKD